MKKEKQPYSQKYASTWTYQKTKKTKSLTQSRHSSKWSTKKGRKKMIVKSWKFTGFNSDMPDWIQKNTSKRKGSGYIWVHTQRGEIPANKDQWISIDLKGHVDIHDNKPNGIVKETIAGAAFIVFVLALLVVMLAW